MLKVKFEPGTAWVTRNILKVFYSSAIDLFEFYKIYRVPTGQWKVREICIFFKVREKSGKSVKWSEKLEILQKSGKSQGILISCFVLTPQKLNKQIWDDDFGCFQVIIICNPVILKQCTLYTFILLVILMLKGDLIPIWSHLFQIFNVHCDLYLG